MDHRAVSCSEMQQINQEPQFESNLNFTSTAHILTCMQYTHVGMQPHALYGRHMHDTRN